jgi:hypothetical protein
MPTTKPRYTVTDTGALAAALDIGQSRWHGVPRRQTLEMLAQAGAVAVGRELERHASAVRDLAGLAGTYPPGYLAELREDWPL